MVDSTPRVSVIIPVRNRRELLQRALDAIAAQTVHDLEVIVVDDGSTDGSGRVAEQAARNGQPVRLIRGDGRGAVHARSMGVDIARAAVLAFTDSDCRPTPTWIEAGLAALEGGAELVQGRTEPDGRVGPLERSIWVLREDGLYATCNLFVRKDAFDRVGGFDSNAGDRFGFRPGAYLRGLGFGEDTLLGWRIRASGTTQFAPDALVLHHVFPMDRVELFKRAWNTGSFPPLIAEASGLRDTFLRHRVVLGEHARLPLYGSAPGW
jgi:glycosyltransferase involved in cell wall biosynthesis